MALIHADFPSGQKGTYGTTIAYMLNGVWAEITNGQSSATYDCLVADPDPNIGSDGVVFYAVSTSVSSAAVAKGARIALPAEVTTLGVGFRWWLAKLPTTTTETPFISFRTSSNTDILTLRVTTTGQLQVASGAGTNGIGGTTLATSTSPVLVANAYSHVEIKCTKGAGTGALEVRVNGVEVPSLTLTSQTLSASNIAQLFIGCSKGSGGSDSGMLAYWKDFVLWDTAGTENNDFMGSVHIYDMLPDADDTLNWTPSTGTTGWDLVNDNDGPDDTTYISAADTLPDATIFTMTDLPEDVTSVRGLIAIGRLMKTDGGDCKVQMALSPDGTNWDSGADNPITVAETYWWDVSEVSPATSSAWTPIEVNALEFRFDRTL